MGKYKDTLRTEKKEFRVTEEESAQIVKQAKAFGMSESAFIRFAVNTVISKKYIPPHLFEQVLHRVCIFDAVKRDKALLKDMKEMQKQCL